MGGKVELLSRVKWKKGESKLRGFMIRHVCFYEGAGFALRSSSDTSDILNTQFIMSQMISQPSR